MIHLNMSGVVACGIFYEGGYGCGFCTPQGTGFDFMFWGDDHLTQTDGSGQGGGNGYGNDIKLEFGPVVDQGPDSELAYTIFLSHDQRLKGLV